MTAALNGATVHGDGCGCSRCIGFMPENTVAVTHGAYAKLALAPRADELRVQLLPLVPFATESDGPAVELLAVTLAQLERAGLALSEGQADGAQGQDRLGQDLRAWIRTADRPLDRLGMTPTGRGRLAGDLAGAQRALTAASLRQVYGADADGGDVAARRSRPRRRSGSSATRSCCPTGAPSARQ